MNVVIIEIVITIQMKVILKDVHQIIILTLNPIRDIHNGKNLILQRFVTYV